jgi:hypothetical protein
MIKWEMEDNTLWTSLIQYQGSEMKEVIIVWMNKWEV